MPGVSVVVVFVTRLDALEGEDVLVAEAGTEATLPVVIVDVVLLVVAVGVVAACVLPAAKVLIGRE